jgi:hypothetical protein
MNNAPTPHTTAKRMNRSGAGFCVIAPITAASAGTVMSGSYSSSSGM